MRVISVLAAAGAGAALGWVCGLVPVWPGVRLAAAAVIGAFAGGVSVVVFVFVGLSRSGSGGLGAVSFGLSEAAVVGIVALALVAVVGYFGLRQLGWSPASLATYGPVIFGGGAALITALWLAGGLDISGGG